MLLLKTQQLSFELELYFGIRILKLVFDVGLKYFLVVIHFKIKGNQLCLYHVVDDLRHRSILLVLLGLKSWKSIFILLLQNSSKLLDQLHLALLVDPLDDTTVVKVLHNFRLRCISYKAFRLLRFLQRLRSTHRHHRQSPLVRHVILYCQPWPSIIVSSFAIIELLHLQQHFLQLLECQLLFAIYIISIFYKVLKHFDEFIISDMLVRIVNHRQFHQIGHHFHDSGLWVIDKVHLLLVLHLLNVLLK